MPISLTPENLLSPQVVESVVVLLLEILAVGVLAFILRRCIGICDRLEHPSLEKALHVISSLGRQTVTILTAVSLLGIIGFNGYLLFQGVSLKEYTLDLFFSVSADTWKALGIGLAKVIGVLFATLFLRKKIDRGIELLGERAANWDQIQQNDESVVRFFNVVQSAARTLVWLFAFKICSQFLSAPAWFVGWISTALVVAALIYAGVLCWRTLDPLLISLDELSKRYSNKSEHLRYYQSLSKLIPLLRVCVEAVVVVAVASLVLAQLEPIAALAKWGTPLIRCIGVFFLARAVVEVVGLLIEEFLVIRPTLDPAQRKVRVSVLPLVKTCLGYAIYFGAGVFILNEIGIDPMPILAGAGILGFAVGLGAQNLINDLIAGFSILFENLYLVGDYVKIGDIEGVVESIDLSVTRVRDNCGRQNIIRNGQVEQVVNFSKEYTFAVVKVGVAYESDIPTVFRSLEEAGADVELETDKVLEPLVIEGLDEFGGSEMVMRMRVKVKPGCHLDVERLLRRCIKQRFDKNGVEIPYAKRVLKIVNHEEPAAA